jgi:nickel/cobalt exporter
MSALSKRSYALSFFILLIISAGIITITFPGIFGDIWATTLIKILTIQRELHQQLAYAIKEINEVGATATWPLILLSFFYGVFHAVGPGHGKIVISTYLLTQETQLRRGLLLTLIASLCQGLTAIITVLGSIAFFNLSMREVKGTAAELELVSYGLIMLVGVGLVISRARRLWRRRQHFSPPPVQNNEHTDLITVHNDHMQNTLECVHTHSVPQQYLDVPISWKALVGTIVSIGIRPCSGAILVLLVSYSMDLTWAGIGAVFAMSLGTAITVSILAGLAVFARKTSLQLVAYLPDSSSYLTSAVDIFGLFGGVAIALFGASLAQITWSAPTHPFL